MLLDKYYTIPEIAKICCLAIKKYIKITEDDIIIEPSAGNGVFIPYIRLLTKNARFYDIKPEHNDIDKQNFLKLNYKENNKLHIIGNPPFGKKSSSAIKFINHSAKLNADSISFILPKSFKKDSLKKSVPLQYHLIYEKDIPPNSFYNNENIYDVNCVFQIWIKRNYNRNLPEKLFTTPYYDFVKKSYGDITIRRVGFGIGNVKICTDNDNNNTNYFIKINKPCDIKDILTKLSKVKFEKNNSVGANSISKQDIIKRYNKIFNKL